MGEREPQRDARPHRQPADHGRRRADAIEDAPQVGDERLGRVGRGISGRGAARMTAGVEADQPVALPEVARLGAEVARAAAEAVAENDGRTVAVALDVQRHIF